MKENKFEFNVRSDTDYNELIADIGFENNLVAILTQEDGFENMRIKIYPSKNGESWDFRLDDFQKVIDLAKKRLWELRKIPENV